MADPFVFDSALTNPGGTANNLTVALSTHAVDDVLVIFLPKTGNAAWTVPTDYLPIDQRSVGNASNGVHGSWFGRKVVSGDALPLADPVCSLGATVTRVAACLTIRNADLEGIFVLPEWGARGFSTGTTNPVSPPDLPTLAPGMLVIAGYGQRSATDAPDPSGYTQDEEAVISGTLVMNVAHKTVTDQNTLLSNQDASPTSGARWVAGLLCIPSADYPYYRSGSQALTASGTSVTGTLPSGTSSSDWRGNKDCIIATVEAAGTPTISPQVGGDWTEITGQAGTTSGDGTTIRRYYTLYDGSVNFQFNRSTSGEIAVCLTTYRNTHQTAPISNVNIRQNASSTTSTWDALTRVKGKSTVSAFCVADATPIFTAPSGWTERMDGNGIVCADQIFNATGSTASAAFTLSSASPTAVGLAEIAGIPATFERSAAISATADITSSGQFFTVFERSAAISAVAAIATSGVVVPIHERSTAISATAAIESSGEFFTVFERAVELAATAAISSAGQIPTVFERAVIVAATADIVIVAEFFSILERASALSATADISASGVQGGPLTFPVTAILDDFNRANQGPPPSSNWTTGVGTLVGLLTNGHRVSSNALIRGAAEIEAESYWSAAQFGPNAECYLTVVSATGLQVLSLGLRIHNIGASTTDGYVVYIAQNFLRIYRIDNGSATALASHDTHTVSSGNKYGINMIGGTIRLWCDSGSGWEPLLMAEDSTYPDAGFLSIYTDSSTATTFDDFGGGTLGGAVFERAASISATADVVVNGQFFSVFERASSLDATAATTVASIRELLRSASLDAVAAITTAAQFFSIFERSTSIDAAASVSASGTRVVDRAATLDAVASIDASGKFFTTFESAASISAVTSVESSGVAFSVFESASAFSATATIETSGERVVDRSVSITAASAIESAAQFFSVLERAVQVDATTSVTVSAQFFSTLERAASFDTTATIITNRQVELNRQVSLSVTATITVSGEVIPPGAVEHERSAAIAASASIESAAVFFSVAERAVSLTSSADISTAALTVRERSAIITATTTITVSAQRDVQRAVSFTITGLVETSGVIVPAGGVHERSVSISTTGTITISGGIAFPTPPSRTFVVESAQRTQTVPRVNRSYLTPKPDRE